ncbi:MAG TPA: hypothetical protein VFV05_01995 [Methylomirabilota bacterium]|nr:hypothetical protein [Methylomirabilota bacterium]
MVSRALLVLALALEGCVSAGPDGPLEPLVVGAEQHLTIEWQPARSNQPTVVWGYVNNPSPNTFDRVRLLVEGLDPAGGILAQRLVWAPGLLGSWGRVYFEAPMGPAPAYRVRVFSYDRVENGGRRRGPFR